MSVRSELTVRLANLAATLNIPVAYENTPFTPPINNGPFIEAILMPSTTVDVTVDGLRQRELGYLQLNVWSKQGVGTKQSEDICNAIKNAFPLIPKIGDVSIEATPSIRQAIIDNSGYRIVPVIINYRLETSI